MAILLKKFDVIPFLDDSPFFQNEDAISFYDCGKTVCYKDNCLAAAESMKSVLMNPVIPSRSPNTVNFPPR